MTPEQKSLHVQLDAATYEVLVEVAEREDRTLNAQARRVLREWADYEREADDRREALDAITGETA